MADYHNFVSAGLQGTIEFNSVLNTPDIITTASILSGLPDAYDRCFHFVGGAAREGLTWSRDGVNKTAPTADHVINGMYFKFSDLSPTTEYVFVSVTFDGGEAVVDISQTGFALILETDGDVRVVDEFDAGTIATINDPFTVDTWHRLEIRTEHTDGDGEIQIWLDGSEILANQDPVDVASYVNTTHIAVGGSPTSSEEVYFASAYARVNSTATTDRVTGSDADQEWEVIGPYSHDKTGASPDDDGGGTGGGGDNLDGDGALWQTTADIPFSDETKDTDVAEYDGTPLDGSCYTDGGSRAGPSGDSNIDGDSNIVAFKGIFRVERGTGGGSTHSLYFGNDNDAGGAGGKVDLTLITAPSNASIVSEDAAVMPLSTENARLGFGVSGNQNIYLYDTAAFVLHLPDLGAGLGPEEIIAMFRRNRIPDDPIRQM